MRKLRMSFYTCKFQACLKKKKMMFLTSDRFPSYSTNFLGAASQPAKGNLRHFFPSAETIAITLLLPLTSRETWKCQLWIKCTNFLSDKWDWRAVGCSSFWDKTLIKGRQTLNRYRRDAVAWYCLPSHTPCLEIWGYAHLSKALFRVWLRLDLAMTPLSLPDEWPQPHDDPLVHARLLMVQLYQCSIHRQRGTFALKCKAGKT